MALQPLHALRSISSEIATSPTRLDRPAFLMSFPFSLSTQVANNAWMKEMPTSERKLDLRKAYNQFLQVYGFMASEGLVYLMPSPVDCGLQDLVYTANLGAILTHLPDRDVAIISNYSSAPRVGEAALGTDFFKAMGYECHTPSTRFEGEAELKHLYGNVYVGGYGERTEPETFDWLERNFDMKIIQLELVDEHLYHLDCSVFPVTSEDTMVCTSMFEREEIAELEKVTNVIDVSEDDAFSGICNSVRLSNTILNGSNLHELKVGTEDYALELKKNRRLEDIANDLAFEVSYFNLSEFLKSGALLSCMVMHLNRYSYAFKLIS